jgi:hypothetical protein
MSIDIDRLTKAELIDLNRRVVGRCVSLYTIIILGTPQNLQRLKGNIIRNT